MTTPDPGLFGPDSVTWRVHGEPIMALAGVRALLLQALHPRAMAGVAQHSSFRTDAWGRLFRTAEYVGTVTYGTTPAAERAGAHVRGLHRRVKGVDDRGTPYAASEPELLRWVHLTEVESFLTTVVRSGLRLSGAEQDRYYAEQVAAARLVGLDPAEVPASRAEVAAAFRDYQPQLRLTEDAKAAARFVLWPPLPVDPRYRPPARAGWVAVAGLGFGLLPRWARRYYRLPGLPTTDVGASVSALTLRTALLALPPGLRHGPAYREAQERMAG